MKYALHTATNYDGTPNQLRGCINDWRNFLVLDDQLQIPAANRISLIAKQYTKEYATEAVSKFASLMEPGDILIGSNSSHGVPIQDVDGDEIDGMDEALVDNDGKYILDDDLFVGLKKFQAGTLVVAFLDNCFSGSMDRAFKLKNWHLMTGDIACNAVMMFGCRERQTAADAYIDGQFQGAMTAYALKNLRKAKFDITYGELLESTNKSLKLGGFTQVAQMAVTSEDLLNKKFFTM